MEQKVVLKESNRCIFFLDNGDVSFYILIPRASSLSLAVSIFDNVDEKMVKNIPNIADKAVIIPIISSDILNALVSSNNEVFQRLDGFLAKMINISYKLLNFNRIEVNNKVIIDYVEKFSSFNNWFVLKYNGRVESFDLGIHVSSIVSKPLFENAAAEPKDINVTLTNFAPEAAFDQNEMANRNSNVNETAASPGFVSYVLLGVIVAVISLVILYMLV